MPPKYAIAGTNVCAGKKRFEVACYKNKILDYRKKIETDLDNVIQIEGVFMNVSKGQKASRADLDKAWGKDMTEAQIVEDILLNGEFQVGEKERSAELERTKHEVVHMVAARLVDPKSKRVYTTGMIEKALDQLSSQTANSIGEKASGGAAENPEEKESSLPKWRGVVASKDAKSQANHAIKCLIAHQPIPVARIQMRLRVTCPTSITKQTVKAAAKAQQAKDGAEEEHKAPGTVKDTLLHFFEKLESQEAVGPEWEAVGLVEPGTFKTLNEFIDSQTKGRGNVEVLDMSVGVDV